MRFPHPGQEIEIVSFKHDGSVHRVWERSTVLQTGSQSWIVGNDQVLVKEADGREWRTREPAICTFGKGQWFNTIGMLKEDGVYYYCNIGSPYQWKNNRLQYIDYDLDVKVFPDMTYVILDEEEFELHRQELNYPEHIVRKVRQGLEELLSLIHQQKGPFEADYIERWYERFLSYK
ncbi:protein of unknown function DUF402 [Caldalkalibacillus thermarum TA2.A1]|uniref:DUF402 domain-containing protein n=1 Tax=Caldalkalibacillus thermarum (strain TA2.A1) TaxID=986075 RepID=F5L3L5_CALTT|nr:DUF402 domain-containing protein [Caldalkalibacillus thermarum]EGL84071.1 protein of unknown function DUF402 [Caldalkalibacillus thermarum TA2.A1]QZT34691.1 DUF402 domain-containing protein [Caldalkalibacillus thermarum TA2.A1]GGK28129.1 UPF0374 protein [Caldalkalibacillus thermarum]